jgi:hypothetical protein
MPRIVAACAAASTRSGESTRLAADRSTSLIGMAEAPDAPRAAAVTTRTTALRMRWLWNMAFSVVSG